MLIWPRPRIVPCLLLSGGGLVKTIRFRRPAYVGDPINAVRIFNDKEVDELLLLDIDASRAGRGPDLPLLERIAREAFMPLGYGGGIRSPEEARRIQALGFEKIAVNAAALSDLTLLGLIAAACGSQSVVAAIDVKRDWLNRRRVYNHVRRRCLPLDPVERARAAVAAGAGEVLVQAADRDGSWSGYDLDLVRSVTEAVRVPVMALGGAGSVEDLGAAVREGGASAAAAGSLFVFHGPRRAVLISYPSAADKERVFGISSPQ
jgi:cyclase